MARVAAARSFAQAVIDECDTIIGHSIDGDDKKRKKRKLAITDALELAGCTTRALEAAEEMITLVDGEEVEPWDGGGYAGEEPDGEQDEDDEDEDSED